MNLFDLYAKVSLDTNDYEASVKNASSSSKKLSDKLSDAAKSSETTKNKIKLLATQYEAANADVERLTKAFNESAKENGYASEETQKLAQELKEAEEKANGLSSELDSLQKNAKNTGISFSDLGEKIKSDLSTAGSIAAKGIVLIAGAVSGALLALEANTEEYRIAQGKLTAAFESAGYSTETAKEAYTNFYKILGDTDTATEASQLLAKLAQSEEDVATWGDIAAGVSGTFGDSLPIESLIEASNETAKVGQVTGALADALNWAGINEDDFNEKLAACTDESDRNRLIMDTLASTYEDAADAFYENSEAIIDSRENQIKLDETMAKLGDSVSKIKNKFMDEFLPSISDVADAFIDMINGVEGSDEKFSSAVGNIVSKFTEKLPEFLSFGAQILSQILAGITEALPDIAEQIPEIIGEIGEAIAGAFGIDISSESITTAIEEIYDAFYNFLPIITAVTTAFIVYKAAMTISSVITAVTTAVQGLTIAQALLNVVMNANPFVLIVTIIASLVAAFVTLWNTNEGFRQSVQNVWNSVVGFFQNAWNSIVSVFSGWGEFFGGLWNSITDAFSGVFDWFYDIGSNIVNGIKSGISAMWNSLVGWFSGLWDGLVGGVKWLLGINSPSKVFADIGKNMALGVEKGWDSEYSNIKKSITDSMDFGKASINFASSGVGISSSELINNAVSSGKNNKIQQNYTFNLLLPDGKLFASYIFKPLSDYARSNGTPILNPV